MVKKDCGVHNAGEDDVAKGVKDRDPGSEFFFD